MRARRSPRREIAVFVVAGLLTLVAVSALAVWNSSAAARDAALREAGRTTAQIADSTVDPLLESALEGDAVRMSELDRAARDLIRTGRVAALVVWDARGRAVWAHDPALVGTIAPEDDVVAAASRGTASTDITDVPDTRAPGVTRVVEAFVPLRSSTEPLVLETNFDYAPVQATIDELNAAILPGAIGALMLLQLVQVPIAASLGRRVRRHEADRAALLERALSASDGERRRIAADLHDGVVPDLATIALAADALARTVPEAQRPMVEQLSRSTRATISALRRLAIDVNPPNLTGAGLPGAVDGLAEPLRAEGIQVGIEVGVLPALDRDVATALYRVAREGFVNVQRHAKAHEVSLWVGQTGPDEVLLKVHDDGVGMGAAAAESGGSALGLRLLHGRVTDLGGRMSVGPEQGGGTTLTASLPLRPR